MTLLVLAVYDYMTISYYLVVWQSSPRLTWRGWAAWESQEHDGQPMGYMRYGLGAVLRYFSNVLVYNGLHGSCSVISSGFAGLIFQPPWKHICGIACQSASAINEDETETYTICCSLYCNKHINIYQLRKPTASLQLHLATDCLETSRDLRWSSTKREKCCQLEGPYLKKKTDVGTLFSSYGNFTNYLKTKLIFSHKVPHPVRYKVIKTWQAWHNLCARPWMPQEAWPS